MALLNTLKLPGLFEGLKQLVSSLCMAGMGCGWSWCYVAEAPVVIQKGGERFPGVEVCTQGLLRAHRVKTPKVKK